MTNEELWQAVLAQIQYNVSRANFATWFHTTKIINNQAGEIMVAVPNLFAKEWLGNKYQCLILKILRSLDPGIRLVEFIVKAPQTTSTKPHEAKDENQPLILESQLQFPEFQVDQKTNLNPRYLFDNFIVGSFNELAHAAAIAVSEKPGSAYNPLFIYGGVGLGKTHLLQATGNSIAQGTTDKKIKYTSSERFISKIVEAIKNQEIEELKKKLARVDVLIIDDVQFFAGKEKTQEEFFHVFNALYQQQKQIILSSDRPPSAIPALEERLRSRFEGGMIADISPPDLETRIAILKTKCQEKKVSLDEKILEYIAVNIQRNIREMEGALNRILVFQKINQKIPDILMVKKLLRSILISPKKATTCKKIFEVVASFFDLDPNELLSTTRRKEIVRPRQITMYLMRQELKESYPSIGRKFRGKDHTTAIYAYEKISRLLEEDDTLLTEINLIKQRIYSDI